MAPETTERFWNRPATVGIVIACGLVLCSLGVYLHDDMGDQVARVYAEAKDTSNSVDTAVQAQRDDSSKATRELKQDISQRIDRLETNVNSRMDRVDAKLDQVVQAVQAASAKK